MGVVIGETAIIGERVTLYHDVTLGGVALSIDSMSAQPKAHPTFKDDVIVGSGAQILGPVTVGRCARVGANAVVTKDVPQGVTVGIPGRAILGQRIMPGRIFAVRHADRRIPDPIVALEALLDQV